MRVNKHIRRLAKGLIILPVALVVMLAFGFALEWLLRNVVGFLATFISLPQAAAWAFLIVIVLGLAYWLGEEWERG